MYVCQIKTWQSFLTLSLVVCKAKKRQSLKILSDSWRSGEIYSPYKHFGGECGAVHLRGRRKRELTPFEWKNLVKSSLEYSTLLQRHNFCEFFVDSYISMLRARIYHWMTESHCLLSGEFWQWVAWNFLYKTWMVDSLSCINGKENGFCIVNWDVLSKTWKLIFDTLCCLRLQWLWK